MSGAHAHGRGTPLTALGLVVAGWVFTRLLFILPFATAEAAPAARAVAPVPATSLSASGAALHLRHPADPQPLAAGIVVRAQMPAYHAAPVAWRQSVIPVLLAPLSSAAMAKEHPSPAATSARLMPPAEFVQAPPASSGSRWSLDTWLFLREGGGSGQAGGPRPGTLGGSQVGVIVRYALAGGDAVPVAAYVRASRALADVAESEVAGGLAIRPLPRAPVSLHAEVRLSRVDGDPEARPAVFVSAGQERSLAGTGLEARGYAQAGYVGGRHATAFAEGQLVVERPVLARVAGSLRIGAGAWGGAQQGVARADAGPVASVELDIADAPVRLEASYRMRIAGAAQPGTGLAVTLSTGF